MARTVPVARASRKTTAAAIARLKLLVERRLEHLEKSCEDPAAETDERQVRTMNLIAQTLNKVMDLERKHRAHRTGGAAKRRILDTARRNELAKRLEALCTDAGPAKTDGKTEKP